MSEKNKIFVNPRTHNGTGILIFYESQRPCSLFSTECSMKRLGRMMCYRFSKPTGYEENWDLESLFLDFCEKICLVQYPSGRGPFTHKLFCP